MSEDRNFNVSTGSNCSPQRRKLLYRKCLGKTRVLQENIGKPTIDALHNIMVDADTMNSDEPLEARVCRTDEVLLDSEVMQISSDILKQCLDTLDKSTSRYDSGNFADQITTYVRTRPDTMLDELHWPSLADDILHCINVTPQYSYLLGTLEPLEKKMVKRKQPQRDARVATQRPERVQAVAKVEDGVEETVQKIKALVVEYYENHDQPLDFFELILNPVDFGRTVENMLHVSFLVRDGYFTLVKEKERLFIKMSRKESISQAKRRGNSFNVQNVLSLSAQQWQHLKRVYKLKQPMINFGISANT